MGTIFYHGIKYGGGSTNDAIEIKTYADIDSVTPDDVNSVIYNTVDKKIYYAGAAPSGTGLKYYALPTGAITLISASDVSTLTPETVNDVAFNTVDKRLYYSVKESGVLVWKPLTGGAERIYTTISPVNPDPNITYYVYETETI